MIRAALALGALLTLTAPAHARVQRDLLRRSNTRVAAQWTLADFLDDQNQASLLNSVLAYDRNADWYEININARAGRAQRANRPAEDQRQIDLDAYLLIFNAHAEYESSSKHRDASAVAVGARVIGTSTRTTNLVVRYGWRRQRDDDVGTKVLEHRFVEGQAQLYLNRWAGLDGGYRHYEPKGARVEGGLFVEVQPFRLNAGYQREDLNGVVRQVVTGGLKAFF